MTHFQSRIKHGGGTHNVDVEVEDDRALITFGSSFTLRLDAQNIDKLRYLLHDASIALACNKNQ